MVGAGTQAGTFAPLVPVVRSPSAPLRAVAGAARTYEIVWYREDEHVVLGLQPIDGRTALVRPVRSAPFAWEEERDPPAGLREAQREHGRMREALLRDGWRRAGRGERWFATVSGRPTTDPALSAGPRASDGCSMVPFPV